MARQNSYPQPSTVVGVRPEDKWGQLINLCLVGVCHELGGLALHAGVTKQLWKPKDSCRPRWLLQGLSWP